MTKGRLVLIIFRFASGGSFHLYESLYQLTAPFFITMMLGLPASTE